MEFCENQLSAIEWKKLYLQLEGKMRHFRIRTVNIRSKLAIRVIRIFNLQSCEFLVNVSTNDFLHNSTCINKFQAFSISKDKDKWFLWLFITAKVL